MTAKSAEFTSFSPKQLKALTWWLPGSPTQHYDGIICDGAVRSGKTLCLTVSFITCAMSEYNSAQFAICGKTIASVRRNITAPLLPVLASLGFVCEEKLSRNQLEISAFGHRNTFYLFGGRDESSASLIQGITLSGVLLDEVALMPRSFAEQAIARCSAEGAKLWFSCNPDHPMHWFYLEWIKKAKEKNCLYIHFTMRDNPSLSPSTLARYERIYTGVFRERFILGRWVAARGSVYPMFSAQSHVVPLPETFERYCVSCDYGTVNPSSFGLWGLNGGVWYRISEYYYDSRKTGIRRTDGEHYEGLRSLIAGRKIDCVIVDPSAASFIEFIRREGEYRATPAKNDVLDGIRRVQDALRCGRILFSARCKDTVREFGLYRWDEKSSGDSVVKENDHAMDDIRYFVSEMIYSDSSGGFCALSVERK